MTHSEQIEIIMLWCSRNSRSTSRPAASSRLTWWTCCGSRVEPGPSRRRRSSGWCRSSTRSFSPFRLSWSRAPVRLSWSWGDIFGYSSEIKGFDRFRGCKSIVEWGKLKLLTDFCKKRNMHLKTIFCMVQMDWGIKLVSRDCNQCDKNAKLCLKMCDILTMTCIFLQLQISFLGRPKKASQFQQKGNWGLERILLQSSG